MHGILKILMFISLIFFVLVLIGLIFKRSFRSSDNKWKRIIGVNIKFEYLFYLIGFFLLSNMLTYRLTFRDKRYLPWLDLTAISEKFILIVLIVIGVTAVFRISNVIIKSTKNDERFNRDTIIVCFQTVILVDVFFGIACVLTVLGWNSENIPALAVCVTILTYVFQDVIKDVFAFYYLRKMGLIHIGDWIKLPQRGVDGEIADASLLSVSIKNWDTTITTLPTNMLRSEVMQNMQNMVDGKTPGRLMEKTFFVDISTIKVLDMNEINALRIKLENNGSDILALEKVNSPTLNLKLFRIYLRHWLCSNDNVSQHPFIMVRLLEPTAYGMPVQIYTYIVETTWMHFEKVQSEIMEHTIEALSWFGMRQYQSNTDYEFVEYVKNK